MSKAGTLKCDCCGKLTASKTQYGLKLCDACQIVEEQNPTGTKIFIETKGEKNRRYVKTEPRR
jgi:hypothetical protein